MRTFYHLAFATIIALSAMNLSGCAGRYLHGDIIQQEAKIRNTPENEGVINLMLAYKHALESMDMKALRSLVSPNYYENSATTSTTSDDYGYRGLDKLVTMLTEHVQDIRVAIKLHSVRVYDEDERADVTFEYAYTMLYDIAGTKHWQTERDVNRFQLHLENGKWRIVSGL